MQGTSLQLSRLLTTTLATAGLALAILTFAPQDSAQAQGPGGDRDMLRLQDQLRDCRGDDCVPVRDQMMTQLRQRLDNCAGGQCDQIRERLQLHERVRDCHGGGNRACRELRMREREQVRPRYRYGNGGGGMGGSMGDGRGRGRGN